MKYRSIGSRLFFRIAKRSTETILPLEVKEEVEMFLKERHSLTDMSLSYLVCTGNFSLVKNRCINLSGHHQHCNKGEIRDEIFNAISVDL